MKLKKRESTKKRQSKSSLNPKHSSYRGNNVQEEVAADEIINVTAWAVHSADEDELKPYTYKLEGSTLKSDQVDVKILNSGLCHTDWHMMKNDWGVTTYPLVPGHEGIGKVVRIGSGVTRVAVGDVVGVGWIADSCSACKFCRKGEENLCGNLTGLILGMKGCFASHTRLNERFASKIPDGMNIDAVGPLLCAGTTVFAPLKRYLSEPGVRVGVIGVGGLGHLAIRYASKMGANVTAVSRSRNREAYFESLGASQTIATSEEDAFTKNAGTLDLLLNCAPTALDLEKYISLLENGGKLILCGVPAANEKPLELNYTSVIFRQITVAGSIVAGSIDAEETIHCANLFDIEPQVEILPMDEVNTAIQRMLNGDFKKDAFRFVLKNIE